jgi:hypothetical protein
MTTNPATANVPAVFGDTTAGAVNGGQPMNDDLISRKALGIGRCNPAIFENKGYAEGWNSAIDIINAAPTVCTA